MARRISKKLLHQVNRGGDVWMVSLTQWTRVWTSSGSWWWTRKPRVLQSTGSQRVGHDWVTELNVYNGCTREQRLHTQCACPSLPHGICNAPRAQNSGGPTKCGDSARPREVYFVYTRVSRGTDFPWRLRILFQPEPTCSKCRKKQMYPKKL